MPCLREIAECYSVKEKFVHLNHPQGLHWIYVEQEAVKLRNELSLIEVKCSIGAKEKLGRPTTTAKENKKKYMDYLI